MNDKWGLWRISPKPEGWLAFESLPVEWNSEDAVETKAAEFSQKRNAAYVAKLLPSPITGAVKTIKACINCGVEETYEVEAKFLSQLCLFALSHDSSADRELAQKLYTFVTGFMCKLNDVERQQLRGLVMAGYEQLERARR